MRVVAILVFVFALYLAGSAIYAECTGVTTMPQSFRRRASQRRHLYQMPIRKSEQPEIFRQFMLIHWAYAGIAAVVSVAIYRRATQ